MHSMVLGKQEAVKGNWQSLLMNSGDAKTTMVLSMLFFGLQKGLCFDNLPSAIKIKRSLIFSAMQP